MVPIDVFIILENEADNEDLAELISLELINFVGAIKNIRRFSGDYPSSFGSICWKFRMVNRYARPTVMAALRELIQKRNTSLLWFESSVRELID